MRSRYRWQLVSLSSGVEHISHLKHSGCHQCVFPATLMRCDELESDTLQAKHVLAAGDVSSRVVELGADDAGLTFCALLWFSLSPLVCSAVVFPAWYCREPRLLAATGCRPGK